MYAVILAAGRGTRMGDAAGDKSKVMVDLAGKPKLEHTLDNLPDEIDQVIIVVGHKKESIQNHFGNFYNELPITYIEQTVLNGTDGAVRACEEILRKEDRFLVINGDDLYNKNDLARLLKYRYGALAYYSHEAKQFGLIYIDDNDNLEEIREKSEKHSEGLVNMGAYMIGHEYFDSEPVQVSETEYGLPHTLLSIKDSHPVRVVHAQFWQPVGTPEQLQEAQKVLQD